MKKEKCGRPAARAGERPPKPAGVSGREGKAAETCRSLGQEGRKGRRNCRSFGREGRKGRRNLPGLRTGRKSPSCGPLLKSADPDQKRARRPARSKGTADRERGMGMTRGAHDTAWPLLGKATRRPATFSGLLPPNRSRSGKGRLPLSFSWAGRPGRQGSPAPE